MPIIINLRGPMAVGKSTIFQELKHRHQNLSVVDREGIKEELKKRYSKPEAKMRADTIIKSQIEFLVRHEIDILTCEIDAEKLQKIAEGYSIYNYFLICSVDEALKRDKIRRNSIHNDERVRLDHEKEKPHYKLDKIIDTEKLTIEQTVRYIEKKSFVNYN